MVDQIEHLIHAVWSLRWWITAIAFTVVVFQWQQAEFDARTLNKLLDMRAEDHAAEVADLRRRLYLRDVADGKLPSRWAR